MSELDIRSVVIGDEVIEVTYLDPAEQRSDLMHMHQLFIPIEKINFDLSDIKDSLQQIVGKALVPSPPAQITGSPEAVARALATMTGIPPEMIAQRVMEELAREDND